MESAHVRWNSQSHRGGTGTRPRQLERELESGSRAVRGVQPALSATVLHSDARIPHGRRPLEWVSGGNGAEAPAGRNFVRRPVFPVAAGMRCGEEIGFGPRPSRQMQDAGSESRLIPGSECPWSHRGSLVLTSGLRGRFRSAGGRQRKRRRLLSMRSYANAAKMLRSAVRSGPRHGSWVPAKPKSLRGVSAGMRFPARWRPKANGLTSWQEHAPIRVRANHRTRRIETWGDRLRSYLRRRLPPGQR